MPYMYVLHTYACAVQMLDRITLLLLPERDVGADMGRVVIGMDVCITLCSLQHNH